MSKVVVLKVGDGDFQQGFPIRLQIGDEGKAHDTETRGRLPPAPKILEYYENWQMCYCRLGSPRRLEAAQADLTNVGNSHQECLNAANLLSHSLKNWLNSEAFRQVREKLLQKLQQSDEVRVIFQVDDILMRLPWHLWEFFELYPKAEIALGAQAYELVNIAATAKKKVRILGILGDSSGIDLEKDRALLNQLPNTETVFLVEPQRQEINDQLWEQPWDILFFAGHSRTEDETGWIAINKTDRLTIDELKHGLRKAITQGLQLAIFNSCDGLGLAQHLAHLQIPQVIVMREPVPDRVAQEFLKYFIRAFSQGQSFYLAVRDARERLQGLEDEFPCATWLPVIFQHPGVIPPNWQGLGGVCTQLQLQPIPECPYQGLSAFQEENAPVFFGREKFTQSLVNAVRQKPLVPVIGPSGSGKSSAILILKKNQRKFCYLNRQLVSKHDFSTDNYALTLEIRNLSIKNRSQLINPDEILTKCLVF